MKEALKEVLRRLPEANPRVVAARSGAQFENDRFTLPFFSRTFEITFPDGTVSEVGRPERPPIWLQITLMHYLLTADGVKVADRWIAFRELPGGNALLSNFEWNTIAPLTEALGSSPEKFQVACQTLGGQPMSLGDMAFRFLAFPRLPMACVLWEGEEGLPPAINMVFDASAPHYLHTEDLSAVAEFLSQALRHGPYLED